MTDREVEAEENKTESAHFEDCNKMLEINPIFMLR